MPDKKQSLGFIQVALMLVLLLGLGVGVYLVSKQTTYFSRASTDSNTNYVLIGDSIAEGYPNWRNETGGDEKYQITYWLQNIMGKNWINSGRASDTADKVKSRLYEQALRHTVNNKGIVVLNVGVNDVALGRTYETYQEDLNSILTSVRELGAQLVLIDIGPGNSLNDSQSRQIVQWNQSLVKWAIENRVPLVSHYSLFGTLREGGDAGNLWNLKPEYSYDGLHLNIAGAQALANLIFNTLKTDKFNTECAWFGRGRCATFAGTTTDGYTCQTHKAEYDKSCPNTGINPQPYCFTNCTVPLPKPSTCADIGGKCATFKGTTLDNYTCKTLKAEFNQSCSNSGINPTPYCFTDCKPNS